LSIRGRKVLNSLVSGVPVLRWGGGACSSVRAFARLRNTEAF